LEDPEGEADMAGKTFVLFDGITGVSRDQGHPEWIEVLSYSIGVRQRAKVSGDGTSTTGTAEFQDFTIVKVVDPTSPILFEYAAAGTLIDMVTVHLTASVGNDQVHVFAKYQFESVVLSSVQHNGMNPSDAMPTETVTLCFSKVRHEYTPYDEQQPGATVRSGWDLSGSTTDSESIDP
jgi:type VI secretion system secreted protein Hcp